MQFKSILRDSIARCQQRGQGMTEYIVIVALIAVAAIGTYSLLGQTMRSQTAGLAQEIAGVSANTAISNAGNSANSAQTTGAGAPLGLKDYNKHARGGGIGQ